MYHQSRAGVYRFWYSFFQFLIFALSLIIPATDIVELLPVPSQYQDALPGWIMISVGVIALFMLVWRPYEKYHDHQTLHKGFTRLTSDIETSSENGKEKLTQYKKDYFTLLAQEPFPYRALVRSCEISVCMRLGKKAGKPLRWWHRLLKHLWWFANTDFSSCSYCPAHNSHHSSDKTNSST